MPTIQEILGVPGFGAELGRTLGSSISGGLSQQLDKYHKRKTFEKAGLPSAYADLDPAVLGPLIKQQQKNALIQQILNPSAQPSNATSRPGFEQGQISQEMSDIGLTPQQRIALSAADPNIGRAAQAEEKLKVAREQKQEVRKEKELKHAGLQNVFDEMSRMVKENAPGIGVSPGTKAGYLREGVQNRNKFNTLRVRLESALVPLVNKGALSKERFKFILDNLPKASDTHRSIVGKLQGLSQSLSAEGIPIDVSSLENLFEKREEQRDVSTQPPTAINPKTGKKLIFKDGKWQPLR